jgi:hypothetical protein
MPSISLFPVSGQNLDLVLDLWGADSRFKKEQVEGLPGNHPLKRYLYHNEAPTPIRSIIASVRKRYNAFAILETPYQDHEFLESFSKFYGFSFSAFEKECERLHFFSSVSNDAMEVIKLLEDGKNAEEISASVQKLKYRGFCVLRPTESYVVGRTAIAFDTTTYNENSEALKLHEYEIGSSPFLTCSLRCEANIFNAAFSVDVPVFLQQDPNLGHCATASLWVVSHLMSKNFGAHHYNYSTITKQAIGGIAREREGDIIHSSERGLDVNEIANALAATGVNPLVITPFGSGSPEASYLRFTHELYSFVESGFPVLLCVDPENHDDTYGHVVTIVGHSLPRGTAHFLELPFSEGSNNSQLIRHHLISANVRVYYAHDDAYGPFNRVILAGPFDETISDAPYMATNLTRDELPYIPSAAIIPAPKPIKNFSGKQLDTLLLHFNGRWEAEIVENNPEIGFFWRSLLVTGAEFKRSLSRRNYSPELKRHYASLHLPKYVWLYEVTCADLNNPVDCFPEKGNRRIHGEFLYDATSPKTTAVLLAERMLHLYRDYTFESPQQYDEISHVDDYECFSRL